MLMKIYIRVRAQHLVENRICTAYGMLLAAHRCWGHMLCVARDQNVKGQYLWKLETNKRKSHLNIRDIIGHTVRQKPSGLQIISNMMDIYEICI